MAKWIYIDAREKNSDLTRATEIYRDNINAFSYGTFTEPGTEEKDTFEKYLHDLNALIDDIKFTGFNENISLIPVGDDNIILDGSHRIAVAAYYDKSVTVIYFPGRRRDYDYKFFSKRLMNNDSMSAMAQVYTGLMDDLYMACLWPRTKLNFSDTVESIIRSTGKVLYSQDVYLNFNGLKNFVANIYSGSAWVGNEDNNFAGAAVKARACYNKHYPVKTFLFRASSQESVLECKYRIRGLYNIDKSSLHISDDQQETEMMCKILYTPENLHALNFTRNYIYGHDYNIPDSSLCNTLPLRYRPSRIKQRLEYQKAHHNYEEGPMSEVEYKFRLVITPARKLYRKIHWVLWKVKHKIFDGGTTK